VNVQSDTNNCATCGSICSTHSIAHAVATCTNATCGVACATGYGLCVTGSGTASSCSQTNDDFNSGSPPDPWQNINASIFSTSSQIKEGTSGVSLTFNSFLQAQAGVKLPLCDASTSMNLQGKTVSIDAFIDAPLPDSCSPANTLTINVSDGNTSPIAAQKTNPPIGMWFTVTGTAGSVAALTAREIDVQLNLCDTTANVNVYLDNFTISP
jgi:hypothetical protein